MKTNIPERIAALREAMKQHQIDAYVNGFQDSPARQAQWS